MKEIEENGGENSLGTEWFALTLDQALREV